MISQQFIYLFSIKNKSTGYVMIPSVRPSSYLEWWSTLVWKLPRIEYNLYDVYLRNQILRIPCIKSNVFEMLFLPFCMSPIFTKTLSMFQSQIKNVQTLVKTFSYRIKESLNNSIKCHKVRQNGGKLSIRISWGINLASFEKSYLMTARKILVFCFLCKMQNEDTHNWYKKQFHYLK